MATLLFTPSAHAKDQLTIATAINFINPMLDLAEMFQKQHEVQIKTSYGSSGKLFAQLQHGAPYDIFLSADKRRPQLLHEQGLCGSPFKYGSGSVVLWQAQPTLTATSWQQAVSKTKGKIAIASPEAAPYGEKAYAALIAENLAQQIKPQLIYGQSVGQTFLFASTSGAKLGFIALSQALSKIGQKGQYWLIPEADPVDQWGCIVVKSKKPDLAKTFTNFLLSETGSAIQQKYGYQ